MPSPYNDVDNNFHISSIAERSPLITATFVWCLYYETLGYLPNQHTNQACDHTEHGQRCAAPIQKENITNHPYMPQEQSYTITTMVSYNSTQSRGEVTLECICPSCHQRL